MKTIDKTLTRRVASLCAAFLSVTTFAMAQDMSNPSTSDTPSAPAPANSNLAHVDRSFIEKATKAGTEEVAISQVAVQRASNPQVKDFAQMMVTDHTSADDSLTSLASTKGVTIELKDEVSDKWTKKDARDFDLDYISKMVSDHEAAVKLFTKESDEGKDADTVAFARKTLATVQQHLEKAEDLKKLLKS